MKIKNQLLLIVIMLFVQQFAFAQPFTLDEKIKPIELVLHKINPPKKPEAKGRIAISNITQTEDTMYYFAKGFSIYAPAYVSVTTKKESPEVKIDLCKQNWKTINKAGSTGSKGHWEDKFKTEGDFGIRIIAKEKPASYSIIIWNGEDVKPDMPSPFKGDPNEVKSESKKGGGGFLKNNLLYIIIGLLVVIIGLMIYKLKIKRS